MSLRTPAFSALLCLMITSYPCGAESIPELISPTENKTASEEPSLGMNWMGLLKQSSLFLTVQHGFRLATEEGTRSEAIPSPGGYIRALSSLHGWSDGDPFYVNYVGHPMQGSVSGYLWVQNDRRYSGVEFGRHADYWRSRLRAFGFMWVYSTQFEIGPYSEAAIGRIQARYPQQGFVDHVVTPVLGLGWQVTEDVLDKYLISTLERKINNPYAGLLLRGWLNPTRSMANLMRGKVPWYRDTRAGVFKGGATNSFVVRDRTQPSATARKERPDLAPLELSVIAGSQIVGGSELRCVGGGAEAAYRLSPRWQMAGNVSGCKFGGMQNGISGDSLNYSAGPRWTPLARNRWSPWVELRLGGNLLTQQEPLASDVSKLPPQQKDASGFAVTAGGGIDLSLNRYTSVRVASVQVTRSWAGNLPQQQHGGGIQLRTGITFKIGNW